MSKKLTMNWDKLAFSAGTRKGRKGGKFVSRLDGRDANGNRPSERVAPACVRNRTFSAPIEKDNTPKVPLKQRKDGSYYFQPRINGKLGAVVEVSESLAKKLLAD